MRFLGKRADPKMEPELEVRPGIFIELVHSQIRIREWMGDKDDKRYP